MTQVRRTKRSVNPNKIYRPWKEWEEGDYIIGKLLGQTIDNYDKPNYTIAIEESNVPELVGKNIGLNSCGSLDNKMEEVQVGDLIEIKYTGMATLGEKHKYKNKDCHTVEVNIFEEGAEEGTDL